MILTVAGLFIALGGFFDLCAPRMPSNLLAKCAGSEEARGVVRELLRALGGCLIGIGAAVVLLANTLIPEHPVQAVTLILTIVLPSEGINASGMYRAGSPFFVPLAFIFITLVGAALGLAGGFS